MTTEELKTRIASANKAYREGNPFMSDGAYDELLDSYRTAVPADEFDVFSRTLNEGVIGYGVKRRHKYIMGSLEKIKNVETDALAKFFGTYVRGRLSVSSKVDGISSVIFYKNGKIVYAATRGDGYEGLDLTDKIRYVRGVPREIHDARDLYVRGELVIKSDAGIESGTNLRNVCAGVMNRKDWKAEDVSAVSFVPYTILGPEFTKREQFELLEKLGFDAAWHAEYDPSEVDAAALTELTRIDRGYACDGLVLTAADARNDLERYKPADAKAFKINELNAVTRVVDVVFEGPSKNGIFCPVAVVEPVELGGSVISRASLHNMDIVNAMGIKYGSEVELSKSNDIIPAITNVVSSPENAREIELPESCPCCGSALAFEGVDLVCPNGECRAQKIYGIESFIKKLGCMNASYKTLDRFGIDSYEKLLSFVPDRKRRSETNFADELAKNVFVKAPDVLFCALNIKDLGEKLQRRIVDFYGWKTVAEYAAEGAGFERFAAAGLPSGIGEITLRKFCERYTENVRTVDAIANDVRYRFDPALETRKPAAAKGSVCFTGSLSIPRGEAAKLAEAAGYEVKSSVSKGLTYLVTPDPDSGSSKNEKAKKLGTTVIDEAGFMKLVDLNAGSIADI